MPQIKHKFAVGDRVRLKHGKYRTVATVAHLYRSIDGGVRLNVPIGNFYSWHEDDLMLAGDV